MPIARFQMPDGRIGRFEVPEGTTPEQAQELISKSLNLATPNFPKPKPQEEAPDTGFTGALKASYEGLKGEGALLAGKVGLMGEAEAQKYYEDQKEKEKKVFKPTEKGWSEDPWEKFKETLGGSLAYMALPAAAGAAAVGSPLLLGGAALTGTAATIAGGAAAGLASAGQFTGANLGRQMEAEEIGRAHV